DAGLRFFAIGFDLGELAYSDGEVGRCAIFYSSDDTEHFAAVTKDPVWEEQNQPEAQQREREDTIDEHLDGLDTVVDAPKMSDSDEDYFTNLAKRSEGYDATR